MKKILSMIAIIVFVSALALTFTACGPVGTYKFESIKYDAGVVHFEYKVGDSFMGVSFDEDIVTLTLKRDGTYALSCGIPEFQAEEGGKWEKDGDKIVFDDGEYTATVKGKELALEYGDMLFVLKK